MTLKELHQETQRLLDLGTDPGAEVYVYEITDGSEPSHTGLVSGIETYGSTINITFWTEDF